MFPHSETVRGAQSRDNINIVQKAALMNASVHWFVNDISHHNRQLIVTFSAMDQSASRDIVYMSSDIYLQ